MEERSSADPRSRGSELPDEASLRELCLGYAIFAIDGVR